MANVNGKRYNKPRAIGDGYGTINFNARDFRRKHDCMPRGVAFWIFYFGDDPSPWLVRRPDQSWMALNYTAAKAMATAEAKRRQVRRVRVDPSPL